MPENKKIAAPEVPIKEQQVKIEITNLKELNNLLSDVKKELGKLLNFKLEIKVQDSKGQDINTLAIKLQSLMSKASAKEVL